MSQPTPHGRSETADGQAWVGRVLDGRYQLLELLGTGGMGSVYAAEHVTTKRRFAVKLLHAELASNYEVRARFEREAMAIGRIEHPNCVDVSDFGTLEDGSLFLAMEFLEGRSLADILESEQRLEIPRALHIIRHLVRGLGHAHLAGIVHRDVKPENVFVVEMYGDSEFAKLLDFGIAKIVGEETNHASKRLTRAGVAFGTPLYISPEQACGAKVDGRADLYSAAVVLFEMIAGAPPFDSDEPMELLSMHTTKAPPTLSEVLGKPVPERVEALVARGLAKRPRERFADAAEFIREIAATLESVGGGGELVGRSLHKDTTAPLIYDAIDPISTGDYPAVSVTHPTQTLEPRGSFWARRGVLVAGGAALVVLALFLVVALRGGGEKRPQMSPSALRAGVAKLIEERKSRAAMALVESQKELVEKSSDGQIARAIASASQKKHGQVLAAVRRAITLDADAAADPVVKKAIRDLFAVADNEVARGAVELGVRDLRDPEAATHLIELASKHPRWRTRHRSQKLAKELGLGDRIDMVSALMLDLDHRSAGYHCRHRRKVVTRLHALGDPRAIPAITEAMERRNSRGRLVNKCLVDEARAAIQALEAKKR